MKGNFYNAGKSNLGVISANNALIVPEFYGFPQHINKSKHVLYCASISRNFGPRNCCQEKAENIWTIINPNQELLVLLGLVSSVNYFELTQRCRLSKTFCKQ